MAFIESRFYSESTGLHSSVNVILPDSGAPKRCLWLLHGLSDDHSAWMRNSAVEKHVEGRNLAVIMPAVGRSFYSDMVHGGKYWTYVSEELPKKMKGFFHLPTGRKNHFAAGLSMGGYGAFKLALKRPDWISAAASFSGALDIGRRGFFHQDFQHIFGPGKPVPAGDDLMKLARAAARPGFPKLRLFQSCGTEDYLYESNQRFRAKAESLKLDLSYEEGPGDHTWAYWDMMLPRALDWFLKN